MKTLPIVVALVSTVALVVGCAANGPAEQEGLSKESTQRMSKADAEKAVEKYNGTTTESCRYPSWCSVGACDSDADGNTTCDVHLSIPYCRCHTDGSGQEVCGSDCNIYTPGYPDC